ncbi:outer membrane protein assembly factor BamD [Arachidicoccus soli]|uniref:Outer membrane protein assembly factor BamD n=1 Tax=Arachidicoccus soli TaxID=2341117 RepID=A0A386HNN7_9BACT|nr:outer membrane protein assembly factor BamD [Arachidicoccus soli]AYD47239.1 outer membrane protein assembly factor BamD [Arachidicoccus soli]
MKRIIQLSLVSLFFILSSCASKYSKILSSKDNEYKYKMAEKYYNDKKYNHSSELFQALFPYLKGSPRYEEAFNKFAYSAFYLKDYESASLAFRTFTENFPNSALVPEAFYMQGYCLFLNSPKVELDQSSTQHAISVLQSFVNTYPKSTKAEEAKALILKCNKKLEEKEYLAAKLYYDLGDYRSAHLYFDLLLSDYPNSTSSDMYMFKTLQSSYEYAKVSVPYMQEERYKQAVEECGDFVAQYSNSKYVQSVQQIKKHSEEAINKIKNIINEQTKKASKS